GSHAAHSAVFAAGRVKSRHRGMRRGASDESVEAAAEAVFAFAHRPFLAAVWRFPDAVWLKREDTRSPQLVAEETARGERHVADHLGFHSETRTAREQTVIRVLFEQRGSRRG